MGSLKRSSLKEINTVEGEFIVKLELSGETKHLVISKIVQAEEMVDDGISPEKLIKVSLYEPEKDFPVLSYSYSIKVQEPQEVSFKEGDEETFFDEKPEKNISSFG